MPSDRALAESLQSHLAPTETNSGLRRFGALLRVIGATDYIFFRSIKTDRMNEYRLPLVQQKLSDNPKLSGVIEQAQMRRELSLAHTEQALKAWSELRATLLSPDNLTVYEERCMKPSDD